MLFIPIVMSAFGGILEESYREGIETLINKIKKEHFVPLNWAASTKEAYWQQRIAQTFDFNCTTVSTIVTP